jgi:ABC-type lipopolysaccharide export system ATPase subunit
MSKQAARSHEKRHVLRPERRIRAHELAEELRKEHGHHQHRHIHHCRHSNGRRFSGGSRRKARIFSIRKAGFTPSFFCAYP